MSDGAIRTAIEQLSGTHLSDKVSMLDCIVISADKVKRLCSVQAVGGKANNIFNCRMMSAIDDGVLIVPAEKSVVTVIMSDFVSPVIIQYSEVEEIIFRGGDLGGLLKVINTVSQLNKIEDKVNGIISAFNSHSHPSNGSPTTTPISGTLTKTVRSDIENTKITHG